MRKSWKEFSKFCLIGGLNTLVDFTVLNLLIISFGIAHTSWHFFVFKITSVVVAATFSFFMNKRWVFGHKLRKSSKLKREILSFVSINITGLLLNTVVSYEVFVLLSHLSFGLSPLAAANIGALSGSIFTFTFNFYLYKFVVFRTPRTS